MSQDVALPSGGPVDRTHAHKLEPGEIALAVVIGRSSEFFDFFVYGIASVLVFPKLLFPTHDPVSATLWSFAIFTLAFLARPIGSVVFMWVGRHHGRAVKMTTALLLLGSSTAAISFLPSYNDLGYGAAALLAIFRSLQGFAIAGAWDGLASLLSLNAPRGKRGWYAMMPQLGAPFGFLLAAGIFLFFVSVLGEADFLDWGWRYPFFCAFAVNVVALFARLRLVVSDAYAQQLETRQLQPVPVFELLRVEGRNVVMGAFAPLATFALFHLVTIFALSYATLYSHRTAGQFLTIEMFGAWVCVFAIVFSGVIADKVGRRTLLATCAVLIGLFAFLTPVLLGAGVGGETTFILIGFALLGLSFGQSSGSLTSNFSPRYRYTGAALTSDLAWLFGAGFAPLVALGMTSAFGLLFSGLYLLSGAICTLASLAINSQLVVND